MKLKHQYLMLVLILIGCKPIDCIHPSNARLSKGLPVAYYNEEYEAIITASVTRDSEDSTYDYDFTFKGELPEGLTKRRGSRKIFITGKPKEIGTFDISVEVHIEKNRDNLCESNEKRMYSIVVKNRKT